MIEYIKQLVFSRFRVECDVIPFTHTWGATNTPNVINNEMNVIEAIVRDPSDGTQFLLDPTNPLLLKTQRNLMFFGKLSFSGYDNFDVADYGTAYQTAIRNWAEYFLNAGRDPHLMGLSPFSYHTLEDYLFTNIHMPNAVVAGIADQFSSQAKFAFNGSYTNASISYGTGQSELFNEANSACFRWSMKIDSDDEGVVVDAGDSAGGSFNLWMDFDSNNDFRIYSGLNGIGSSGILLTVSQLEFTAAGLLNDNSTFYYFIAEFNTAANKISLFYNTDGSDDYLLLKQSAAGTFDAKLLDTSSSIYYGASDGDNPALSESAVMPSSKYNGVLSAGNGTMAESVAANPQPFADANDNVSVHFVGYKIQLRGLT